MAKTRTRLKKLLALMLALSMTMGLLNLTAFAAGSDNVLTVEVGSSLTLNESDGKLIKLEAVARQGTRNGRAVIPQ